MNIKIDIDVTPEEMRRLMGLPDVSAFNAQVMEKMSERLAAGLDGYDPMNFFQASLVNNTDFAKQWMDMLTSFTQPKKD